MKNFERVIVYGLLIMLMLVVLFATVELGYLLAIQSLGREAPTLLLDFDDLLNIFGFFLLVLIGIELAETIYAYLEEEKIHVEVVFLVAMVAVARKVITLDYMKVTAPTLYGVAAIALALTVGYFLLKKAMRDETVILPTTARKEIPPPEAG
jgi:uncharacterized membrane protein (DUF373 family)